MAPPGSNYAPTSHGAAVAASDARGASPPAPPRGHDAAQAGSPAGTRSAPTTARSIAFGVLSISDVFTEEDDASGDAVKALLKASGHRALHYALVANSVADIREAVGRWLADPKVEAVITIGGTGVSSRDVTVEALGGLGGKSLEGFGDLYRMLSYQEVGPLAVLSRASLYALQNRPVFAVPGSERGCRLALSKLVLPAVEHLVEELAR